MNTAPDSTMLVNLIKRFAETAGRVSVDYMSEELGTLIDRVSMGICQSLMQGLVQQGLHPAQAFLVTANMQAPIAFQFGLLIGQELEQVRAFTEQFGGDG